MKGRCVNNRCPRYGDEREMVEDERCYPCMHWICPERPLLFNDDDLRHIRLHLDWSNDEEYEAAKQIELKLRPYVPELRAFDLERRNHDRG